MLIDLHLSLGRLTPKPQPPTPDPIPTPDQSSYGWVECVGHADRACYDLDVHSKKSKVPLIASQTLPEPKEVRTPYSVPATWLGRVFGCGCWGNWGCTWSVRRAIVLGCWVWVLG